MTRVAVLLFCLFTIPLRANLGETVEQCVTRYGHPVGYTEAGPKNPFGTVVFSAAGYTLVVFVAKNKEVGARVSKSDKSAFTDVEKQNIMNADSMTAAPWASTTSDDPTCLRWTRADKATVLYDKDKHVLIFTSDEMEQGLHSPPPATTQTSTPPQTNAPTPAFPPRSVPVAPAPPTQWPTSAPTSTNAASPSP